ncbi:MAG TPA: alkaline phosphatase [Candidatus Marinimicrobia bacterium]|nr:alkaline phosphatase [Candidatus Neomarinimicrobiota bacterium]
MLHLSGCEKSRPKSLILFIGSGMGVGHLSADHYLNSESPFRNFEEFALLDTRPDGERWITDAAAAATAIATGEMVKPGTVSSAEDDQPIPTILEIARQHAKSTGVVATTSLTQAVPAAFLAHARYWGREFELARQIALSGTDVLLGGGRRFFEQNSAENTNLIPVMQDQGYQFISRQQQLENLDPEKTDKLLGLFAAEALRQADHRNLTLEIMTEKAVQVLEKNRKGFVLVVEGSQIDWRAHERDAHGLLTELEDFSEAVAWALTYQKKHLDLLIVVTGLNETGGVFLIQDARQRGETDIEFITSDHTANLCPVMAKGPQAQRIRGIMTSSDLGKLFISLISG